MRAVPASFINDPNIGARELRRCVLSPTGLATRRPEQPCSKSRKTTSAWPSAPKNEQGGSHHQNSHGSQQLRQDFCGQGGAQASAGCGHRRILQHERNATARTPFRSEPSLTFAEGRLRHGVFRGAAQLVSQHAVHSSLCRVVPFLALAVPFRVVLCSRMFSQIPIINATCVYGG